MPVRMPMPMYRYVHGGVYLDLDAAISGPLDAAQNASGGGDGAAAAVDVSDGMSGGPPIGPRTREVFMYDAEANLT